MARPSGGGMEALHRLKSTEPPLWLSPSPELSQAARTASQYLFTSLNPFCPKSPFDRLLVEGFDAEQIWQQIDLQTHSLMPNLRRELKRFEKNPNEISKLFGGEIVEKVIEEKDILKKENEDVEEESEKEEDFEDFEEMGDFDEEEGDEEDEEEEGGGAGGGGDGSIEDRFLKIKELEEYMEKDEAREYGASDEKQGDDEATDVDEDDDEDEDEEEEDDELEGLGADAYDDEGTDKLESARYEDFFGGKNKKVSKRLKSCDESEDLSTGDEKESDHGFDSQGKKESLSTHERELQKLHSKIQQMEKANLEPKTWTMQGEVTAAKRPKNSALEVDLDFEHNVRPVPVITEEVTASLEDLIKKRILEGHFDDVQKAPSLPSKAPKEIKEMDENKSKKGLAEIYEEEYVQKTGLAAAPLTFSDEQKKEASILFKQLCLKLDALSHFNFTPKPIIEDMSIPSNVPALAMEEIAPVAVSDAAMLAPEEVFAGKGDIKEEGELTQAERKRRRAKKKRKFKAESAKKMAKKAKHNSLLNLSDGQDEES